MNSKEKKQIKAKSTNLSECDTSQNMKKTITFFITKYIFIAANCFL